MTMKAVVCTAYGGPDVLKITDLPKPEPGPEQLLIKIYATSVNSGDCRIRRADPPVVKLIFGFSKPRAEVLGVVVAGVVEKTGSAVTKFRPGDKVYGMTGLKMGGYAEYTCIKETGCLALIPESISYTQAAAIPFGGTTAVSFFKKAGITSPGKVLIIGASGAVGTAAVQVAKYFGHHTTAVCSRANTDMVTRLGADKVIDYTATNISTLTDKYDLIFETVGKNRYPELLPLLSDNGVLILGSADFKDMLFSNFASKKKTQKVLSGTNAEDKADLEFINQLLNAGKYTPVIDKTYSLAQIPEAHTYTDSGHKKGNVVITVAEM